MSIRDTIHKLRSKIQLKEKELEVKKAEVKCEVGELEKELFSIEWVPITWEELDSYLAEHGCGTNYWDNPMLYINGEVTYCRFTTPIGANKPEVVIHYNHYRQSRYPDLEIYVRYDKLSYNAVRVPNWGYK